MPGINTSRISITGHSRNGKQSLITAAFDERFASVVGSSPGTPIAAPVRFSSPDFNGETLSYVTTSRDWWLPSLATYFGREHELPADGHMVLALIAPRHALLATADSDGEGDVTFAGTPLPVVILLHGHSYQLGYSGIYGLYKSDDDGGLIDAITSRGVAVLAWDLVGMGSRQHVDGAPEFYRRQQDASRLGSMVGEVHAALEMIHCASTAAGPGCSDGEGHTATYPALDIPLLDPSRVYLLGYSLGAIVALHAAPLAPAARPIAGLAAFSGWTPWRTGAGGVATGGLRMLYETHALLPRLGDFEGQPEAVPYDYDELIMSLAPRPTLLFTPALNRFANATDVALTTKKAKSAWAALGAEVNFEVQAPADSPSDMRTTELGVALGWVDRVVLAPTARRKV